MCEDIQGRCQHEHEHRRNDESNSESYSFTNIGKSTWTIDIRFVQSIQIL